MRGELYQIVLIALGAAAAVLFGLFLFRELNPEYKIYQNDYAALENFRSTYMGESPPTPPKGIQQIVLKKKDKGPETIDRCISCHVALKFEHFSPTKIAYDINGNMRMDADGFPVQVPNEHYVWSKLDEAIAELSNMQTNDRLAQEGKMDEVKERLELAEQYASYKTAKVGKHSYDVTKVLRMHPLIGRETRPFDLHPLEEYGCTSCHNGNGKGLTTEKAHGPVFDGQYEVEFMGPVPQFLEKDENNDPAFSKIFNSKPGHALLFQTTPILIGSLMEAKCIECHKTGVGTLDNLYSIANHTASSRRLKSDAVMVAYQNEIKALQSLLDLKISIQNNGFPKTLEKLEREKNNPKLASDEKLAFKEQAAFLRKNQASQNEVDAIIGERIDEMVGSQALVTQLLGLEPLSQAKIEAFIKKNKDDPGARGTLFRKAYTANLEEALIHHVKNTEQAFHDAVNNQDSVNAMKNDIDLLTHTFQTGKQLYISQACYACHRIAGFARGGVGPDLTAEGHKYPWFIKESIVWPQADLKTSQMPNFRLDHVELEALMTFLLAQTGDTKTDAETQHKISLQKWEDGKKMSWEKPISPAKMHDINYAMEVFATEGCAACHRLKGFKSDTGFTVEKDTANLPFETLYGEKQWFSKLFPEEVAGTQIVEAIENNREEIDRRIAAGVRKDSILEKIESRHPDAIESLYSNFRFASRAKNHTYEQLANSESDPVKKAKILNDLKAWKERVRHVLMIYVQEYGLGRLIGPSPNWSGIYRSNEWLMEHFRSPSSLVARSIMPVLPFDISKFYALTNMLNVLAIRNRDEVRQIWEHKGFNPHQAYDFFCAQCHGEYQQGDGPVAAWIYPIPKNLRNADFLRNLSKENVYESIIHGVKGTPMPGWGEVAPGKPAVGGIPVISKSEAAQIVDWLFSFLPGGTVIRSTNDVPKWKYSPEDIVDEMEREGGKLNAGKQRPKSMQDRNNETAPPALTALPTGEGLYAALQPIVFKGQANTPDNSLEADEEVSTRVSDIFDIAPNLTKTGEKYSYYIKKKYYTPEHLSKGRAFFELNCAICHGREADGSGNRAASMNDAKPRMLTNLDWLDTRDDLRLLRSIKYGVKGTSMTAWGDQTSSQQRLQLVMYIRSLSQEAKLRDQLFKALYKAYSEAELKVENARIKDASALVEAEQSLKEIKRLQNVLYEQVKIGATHPDEAVKAYQEHLTLLEKLNTLQQNDGILQKLIQEIRNEKRALQELGLAMIAQATQNIDIGTFYELLHKGSELYTFEEERLALKKISEAEIQKSQQQIIGDIDASISELAKEIEILRGKIRSPEADQEIKDIFINMELLVKLKNNTISMLEEAKRSRERQTKLVEDFNEKGRIVE